MLFLLLSLPNKHILLYLENMICRSKLFLEHHDAPLGVTQFTHFFLGLQLL